MPRHIAMIMDGNGRWATQRGLPRTDGHRAGANQLEKIAHAATQNGVKYITLYAFSTENWKRPADEVNALMKLLKGFIDTKLSSLMEQNIRIKAIGRIEQLPLVSRTALKQAIKKTADNTGLTVTLALSYGGRAEIIDAVNRIIREGRKEEITEEAFHGYLYDPELPDPELMIRTGGEHRLSNFLLWQLSYAELYVTDVLWPDFDGDELKKAIDFYRGRDRRFGNVK